MPNFHMRRPPWAVYGESQRASPGRRHPRHRGYLAHSLAVRSGIPLPHHRRGHVGPRGLSRGNRLLAARRFESPAGPWGSLVWARGPRVIRPTGNPTSLGCWRLRFKSGRTHLQSGSEPICGSHHSAEGHVLAPFLVVAARTMNRDDRVREPVNSSPKPTTNASVRSHSTNGSNPILAWRNEFDSLRWL